MMIDAVEHDDGPAGDLFSHVELQNDGSTDTRVVVTIANNGQYGPERSYSIQVDDLSSETGDAYEPDLTTKRYMDGVKQRGWPPFPGKLWQRNYYEHIIRDETDLNGIRRYIVDNPAGWMEDAENPEGFKPAPTDDAGTEQGEAQR